MSTKRIKVFLDSSVLVAGMASKTGSSHMVLALAEAGVIEPFICEQVVTEVIRNSEKKLPALLPYFYALFKVIPFRLKDPSPENLCLAVNLINEKDAPILAAVVSAKTHWLLSLDRHFLNISPGSVPFKISTPATFLRLSSVIHHKNTCVSSKAFIAQSSPGYPGAAGHQNRGILRPVLLRFPVLS